ncbi:hypothetical protein C8Q78DRAFT_620317 [Trametes maxima]|nr:hypothetical protein C8Q78DRAFT_620317 [Trametes maxima]
MLPRFFDGLQRNTLLRHRKEKAPPHVRASQALRNALLRRRHDAHGSAGSENPNTQAISSEEEMDDGDSGTGNLEPVREDEAAEGSAGMDTSDSVDLEPPATQAVHTKSLQESCSNPSTPGASPRINLIERLCDRLRSRAQNPVVVEDDDSDEDEDEEAPDQEHSDSEGVAGEEDGEWDDDDDIYNPELSAQDRLYAKFMQEAAQLENRLSEPDKAILRAFAFAVQNNLNETTFQQIPAAFPTEQLPTLKKLRARVAFLSGIDVKRVPTARPRATTTMGTPAGNFPICHSSSACSHTVSIERPQKRCSTEGTTF